jgi:hypothetical protein
MATVSRGLKGSAGRAASYPAPQSRPLDEPDPAPPPADVPAASPGDAAGPEHPVDERQRRFDRLTRGLLQGLPPARP